MNTTKLDTPVFEARSQSAAIKGDLITPQSRTRS